MSNNIYDILGKLKGLNPTETPVETAKEPVYESVEPKGDIMEAVKSLEEKYQGFKKTVAAIKKGGSAEDPEAVAASIGRKKYGKKAFQKAAAAGKKMGESKEEYCDACDSTECHCDEVTEGKELKNKAQFDAIATKGDYYVTSKGNKVIKTDTGVKHEKVHGTDKEEDDLEESAPPKYVPSGNPLPNTKQVGTKFTPQGTPVPVMATKKSDELDEVAPPGAKAERMVKHIKKGYSKDGKLTPKEKSIAYATAWKAHNKGQVEEGTEFGDTIKNSKAELTKVTVKEGKEEIRNHPIYTDKNAWDHYKKELDEQEAMEETTAPAVVNVQQELDEIAKLAGLPVKAEAKEVCPTCKCEQCECHEAMVTEGNPTVTIGGKQVDVSSIELDGVESWDRPDYADAFASYAEFEDGTPLTDDELEELSDKHGDIINMKAHDMLESTINEAATRKDFRMVADLIKNIPDAEKRKELAHHHAEIFKKQNPRFKHDVFCKACGLDECDWNMEPKMTPVMDEEQEMDEGNEFTKARLDAIAAGKDEFTVGGKVHKVTGDTSQEKSQVEESTTVTEDVNINVSATGEEDVVKLIQKLAGMPVVHKVAEEEVVEEERDIEWDNTPNEKTAPISAAIPDGNDLHKSKKQDPHTANKAANPLGEEKVEESLWKAYEEMINDVKA
jgi:uncharacterized Zn-binding protein involved in type VI secretion